MGHAFRRCSFKTKVKKKRIGKKKNCSFLDYFFNRPGGSFADEAVGPGRSQRSVFILNMYNYTI